MAIRIQVHVAAVENGTGYARRRENRIKIEKGNLSFGQIRADLPDWLEYLGKYLGRIKFFLAGDEDYEVLAAGGHYFRLKLLKGLMEYPPDVGHRWPVPATHQSPGIARRKVLHIAVREHDLFDRIADSP